MSTRPLGHILVAIASALILLALVGQSLATVQAARQHAIAGNMYVVDSTTDTVDADVANLLALTRVISARCAPPSCKPTSSRGWTPLLCPLAFTC